DQRISHFLDLAGREAVERMANVPLRARRARWVLLQQILLRAPQLSGVVILHLLLQRAGCRGRQGHAWVHDVWRLGDRRAALLGRHRGGCKRSQAYQQGRKQHVFHRTPPLKYRLWTSPSSGGYNISSVDGNLSSLGKTPISCA